MKVPDANVLLFAHDQSSPHHATAREWLEGQASPEAALGLAWVALLALLRIGTRFSAFGAPLEVAEALEIVDELIALPAAEVLAPTSRHAGILRELLVPAGTGGDLTTDAHLAALAIEHGATLATFDTDFHRFEKHGLKLEYLG